MGKQWKLTPPGPPASARQCKDGLVHWTYYHKLKGATEPGQWLRVCDANDDFVVVMSLPMSATDVTCVSCVALETKGCLCVRDDA